MQEDTLAQLAELLSISRLLQVALVLAFAWLLLRGLDIGSWHRLIVCSFVRLFFVCLLMRATG